MIKKWLLVGLACLGLMAPGCGGTTAAEGPLEFPMQEGASQEAQKHNEEGIMHFNKGHYEEALKHFRTSMKIDPKVGASHFNAALALHKMEDHGAATQHFKKAKEHANGRQAIVDSQLLKEHIGG